MNLPTSTVIKVLWIDNTEIFIDLQGFEKYDSSVYIWCDLQQPFTFNYSKIKLDFMPIYIGKGKTYGGVTNWRACTHHNDAITKIINENPKRYECYMVSMGIPDFHAACLEAKLIQTAIENYGFQLTKPGTFPETIQSLQLLNKQRERKKEIESNTILKF